MDGLGRSLDAARVREKLGLLLHAGARLADALTALCIAVGEERVDVVRGLLDAGLLPPHLGGLGEASASGHHPASASPPLLWASRRVTTNIVARGRVLPEWAAVLRAWAQDRAELLELRSAPARLHEAVVGVALAAARERR